MTYEAEINRSNPACLLLLIDQLWSMAEQWYSAGSTKAQALAFAVNRLLSNSILLCTKGAGRVYDYFDVRVIGYGLEVAPVLAGSSLERPLLPISQVADTPVRVDSIQKKVSDGAGGLVETTSKMPIWFDAKTEGATPMVRALTMATDVVSDWCRAHPGSFPPMVVNITDGASTDGDPREVAKTLQRTGTSDGPTLLFNLHLSSSQLGEIVLPSAPEGLPNPTAVVLFESSSVLPEALAYAALGQGFAVSPGARGFMYNADVANIIEFLNLGTRAVTPGGLRELEQGSTLG